MARTRKQVVKRTRKVPKIKKPTFIGKIFRPIAKLLAPVGRTIAKLARRLGFLLKPFKTKPAKLIGRVLRKILLIDYIKNSWQELRQVVWPGRRETTQLTLAVFAFAIVFGLLIAAVDYGLDKLFKELLL